MGDRRGYSRIILLNYFRSTRGLKVLRLPLTAPHTRDNFGAKTESAQNFVKFLAEVENMGKVGHTMSDFAKFDWSAVRLRQILWKFLAKSIPTLPRRENLADFAFSKKRVKIRGGNCGKYGHELTVAQIS